MSIVQPHQIFGIFPQQGLYTSPSPRYLSSNTLLHIQQVDRPIGRQNAFADENIQLWRPVCGHTGEHHKGHDLIITGCVLQIPINRQSRNPEQCYTVARHVTDFTQYQQQPKSQKPSTRSRAEGSHPAEGMDLDRRDARLILQ